MKPLRRTALLILAAGNSSRLGRPKQLLRFEGMTLLHRAIRAGLDSHCHPVSVILGAYHDEILEEPYLNRIKLVYNRDWESGMSSSIKAGMRELLKEESPEQVILMLCDQPFVDGRLLNRLIATQQETGKGMVACTYKNTVGVPALFDNRYFSVLMNLAYNGGAKKIIQRFREELAVVPFKLGSIDIDTAGDYKELISESIKSR